MRFEIVYWSAVTFFRMANIGFFVRIGISGVINSNPLNFFVIKIYPKAMKVKIVPMKINIRIPVAGK